MSMTPNAAPPGHLPPLVSADDTHQRASVIIATSVLLFSALLFVGARVWVRQNPDDEQTGGGRTAVTTCRTLLGFDDLLLVISTALYVVHSALIFSACAHGLGDSVRSISLAELERAEKLYYASNIFYVLSLGSSKASISYLMVRINSSRAPTVKRSMKGILYLIILWTAAMFFLTIFACPVNSGWMLSVRQCPNWFTKWVVLGVSGCCFEVAVAGVAVWNVWSLNTTLIRKALVVALFAMRLPLILLVVVQLSLFHSTAFNADPTLHSTNFICLTELVLCYSICSANFPAFRRLTNDIRTDFGGFGNGTMNTFQSSRKLNRSNSGYMRSTRSGNDQESDTFPINPTGGVVREARRQSMRPHPSDLAGGQEAGYSVEVRNGNGDNRSVGSQNASEYESTEMIIRTRTEVVVRSDGK